MNHAALISDENVIGHQCLQPLASEVAGQLQAPTIFPNCNPPTKPLAPGLGIAYHSLPRPLCVFSVWAETYRAVNFKLHNWEVRHNWPGSCPV